MAVNFSEADYKRFRDRMELCEIKMGGGRLGYNVVCLGDLIRDDPPGAQSFFEYYLVAAQTLGTNYVKLAAIVAIGYMSVHKDDSLVRRLDALAGDPAVRAHVESIQLMWNQPPRSG